MCETVEGGLKRTSPMGVGSLLPWRNRVSPSQHLEVMGTCCDSFATPSDG